MCVARTLWHLEEGRFAAAIDPHQPQLLPLAHGQGDIFELITIAVESIAHSLGN